MFPGPESQVLPLLAACTHDLDHHACEVVYIVTRASNQAAGVLKEIAVASAVGKQLKDSGFIIPVKIDDLPYADHNIEINRLNALSFTKGWATGLSDLLRTLKEDNVPRNQTSGPSVVASWWNDTQLNRELVRREEQTHWTNWFPVQNLPTGIWIWRVPEGGKTPEKPNWPAYRIGDRYVSFASAKELTGNDRSPTGGRGCQIAMSVRDNPPDQAGIRRGELCTAVKQILRQSWDIVAQRKQLPLYQLSSNRRTIWFPSGSVSPNGVPFTGVDGSKSDRQLYGFKTVGPKGAKYKRFYHYGLECQVITYPEVMLSLKSHVIFTLDGNSPHRDPAYQHRARRSQCKKWWNDRWRDLMLAAMASIGDGLNQVSLPLAEKCEALIANRPLELVSPVRYEDEHVKTPADEQLGEFDDPDRNDDSVEEGGDDAE